MRQVGRGGRTRARRANGAAGDGASAAKTQAVIAGLKAIYKAHVPDKDEADVEDIIARFAGREEVLLRKVRAKYLRPGPEPELAPGSEPEPELGPEPEPEPELSAYR